MTVTPRALRETDGYARKLHSAADMDHSRVKTAVKNLHEANICAKHKFCGCVWHTVPASGAKLETTLSPPHPMSWVAAQLERFKAGDTSGLRDLGVAVAVGIPVGIALGLGAIWASRAWCTTKLSVKPLDGSLQGPDLERALVSGYPFVPPHTACD